jgi:diguanylate cyclase (GGDEF)-like protein
MSALAVAALAVGLVAAALAVWAFRLRDELTWLRGKRDWFQRELDQQNDRSQSLTRRVRNLPHTIGRLFAVSQERELPALILDAVVDLLNPEQALIAVNRRRSATHGSSSRMVVAAVHPRDAGIALGTGVSWRGEGLLRARSTKLRVHRKVQAGQEAFLTLEWAAPMMTDGETVGLIALSACGTEGGLTEALLQSLADSGALALKHAAARQSIRTTAQVDELTQLFNRRQTLRVLSEELRRAQQDRSELSVFLFDIDHFKHYNDLNGHIAGDILLRLLGDLFRKRIRARDTVGRFGGEEFLLILPETDPGQALGVADGLRELIAAADFPARERQPLGFLSVSGGIAQYPAHGATVSALIKAADQALYEAKRTGRNRVCRAASSPRDDQDKTPRFEEELD